MARERAYKHGIGARTGHWLWTLALVVLVTSGLQIFNAAPYLDLSDKSDPAKRILAFDGGAPSPGAPPVGTTTILGHTFQTTHVLGFADDGLGGETARAFPGWLTLPNEQSLADGRRWHLFFGWALVIALGFWYAGAALRGELQNLILRPSDLPKLWPMQAYYLRLRREPPPYGSYNPLQKAGYTTILFVVFPFVVITGLALSPGMDATFPWLTPLLGGRQFARTWHFLAMAVLLAFTFGHLFLVATTGFVNNMRSMISGWANLEEGERVGP